MGNPQTLNLYSYVENNPITGTDPDGHTDKDGSTCEQQNTCDGKKRDEEAAKRDAELREWMDRAKGELAAAGAKGTDTQYKAQKQPGGLVYTPRDMPDGGAGILGQLFGKLLDFLGITFVTPSHGDTLSDDPPVPIPVPKNLLWIEEIVNGHGWTDHGEEEGSRTDGKS